MTSYTYLLLIADSTFEINTRENSLATEIKRISRLEDEIKKRSGDMSKQWDSM